MLQIRPILGLAWAALGVWVSALDIATAHAVQIEVAPPGGRNVMLHAEESGQGEPVLLLHGLGASTFSWRRIAPALSHTHRVIALDLKGFGRSEKPFDLAYSAAEQAALVATFIRRRGLSGVTLIGHSFGGNVALLTALTFNREPGRIARLVIIDSPALPQSFPPGTELVATPGLAHALLAPIPPEVMARLLLGYVREPGSPPSQEDVLGYAAPYYDLGARHAFIATAQAILAANAHDLSARYKSIGHPVLLVWCRADRLVPAATGKRLLRVLPRAKLALLRGCNHLPMDEQPAALLAQLRPFLRR